MEIRNLKLIYDGNKIAIFDLYVPKYKGTFKGLSLIKGKKGEFISFPSKREEREDGSHEWIKYFEPDEEIRDAFYSSVKQALKDAMNKHEHEMHKL